VNEHPIILFDGVCNFCNGAVNFIIKRDKERVFRFAPLQSEVGQELLKEYHLPTKMESFVLICKGKAYKKTSAALQIASILGGAWKITGVLWILPPFARDWAYTIIANNRYKWFGKKDACMIPTPEIRSLFLG